eukprot:9231020-Pyramimonas_sp.AAC.1
MLCIRQQKPYLGYCPTEKHRSMLSDRLECLVFDAFQTVGDSLYEAGLAELVNPDGNEEEPAAEQEDEELAEDEETPPKPPPTPKPAGRGGRGNGRGGGGRGRGGRGSGSGSGSGEKGKLLESLKALESGQ